MTEVHLGWWLLALLSAVAELALVRVRIRRVDRAVALREVPLLLGLYFAGPVAFLVGRSVGVLAVRAVRHRSAALLIDVVRVALESVLALLVFRAVSDAVSSDVPERWLPGFAAAGVLGLVSTFSRAAVLATVQSLVIAVGGLITVELIVASRWNALLAALAFGALTIGFRAYGTLAERHLVLERLYRFSQVISGRPEVDEVLLTVLGQAAEVLGADQTQVLFLPGDEVGRVVRVSMLPGRRLYRVADPMPTQGPLAAALGRNEPVLIARDTRDRDERRFLVGEGLRDAIIVPLRGEAGLIGALLVADRVGEQRTFDAEDVLLLETVANHAGMALRNSQLIDQLRYEASHDTLTGLPNRTALRQHLDDLLASASSGTAAVLLLDLNGFKQINDTLGHQQGDELLRHLADRLAAAIPPGTFVARLGGDEFAVVVSRVPDAAHAVDVGHALAATLTRPVPVGGITLAVSASLGIALAPEHGADTSTLLRHADMAMYQAKASDRGVVLYDPAAGAPESPAQLALVSDLRRAIGEGQLTLYVQPKARADTGEVDGVEALVRWVHPEQGTIMPDEFVPIAERNGLIRALTSEVLRQAVRAVAGWREAGITSSVAVNLSARGLADADLVGEIAGLLAKYQVGPSALTLEVTEGSIMTDPDRAADLMERFHELGLRLSIDDFGTGYSSLSRLRRLALDEIKIDKSFVAGLEESDDDEKIVRSMVDLGAALGLDVVAEGVENQRIWQLLRRMGATHVQGFYLTRPIPIDDYPAWLADYRRRRENLAPTG